MLHSIPEVSYIQYIFKWLLRYRYVNILGAPSQAGSDVLFDILLLLGNKTFNYLLILLKIEICFVNLKYRNV